MKRSDVERELPDILKFAKDWFGSDKFRLLCCYNEPHRRFQFQLENVEFTVAYEPGFPEVVSYSFTS